MTRAPKFGFGRDTARVRTYLFVSFVWVLAIATSALAWRVHGSISRPWALLLLICLGLVGWVGRENDVGQRIQFSFISIVILAALAIVGPVGAAVVGGSVSALSPRTMPRRARAFNTAMFAFLGASGGLVYLAVGAPVDVDSVQGTLPLIAHVGFPLMVAEVAQCVLNALLLAGIQWVANAVPARAQVWSLLATTGPAYVGYGIIGFLFVLLWIPARVGWFSAVLVLAPLFVARWAFAQYGDELRAHERTLRALVTAVEIKEPQSQGHSERVAQLSEWLAESLGLGHKEIQDVRTAGMLHDIGKISVPTPLLRGRRRLTDDELVVVADHARAGVELVSSIDFVAASLDGIAHHHERWDGLGYPAGLSAEQIPLTARIVAVADAFDALTSARSYRDALTVPDALTQVHERAGTHLDPAVVQALGRVVSRHGWQPRQDSSQLLEHAAVATDHDDPEMSDYFAERADLRARIAERGSRPAAGPSKGREDRPAPSLQPMRVSSSPASSTPARATPPSSTHSPSSSASSSASSAASGMPPEPHRHVGGRL